jgi:hypothetical protein
MKSTEEIPSVEVTPITREERIAQMIEEDTLRMKENEKKESAVISKDEELLWVRSERNRLIAGTDWTQLPDVPEATRTAWQAYRQELRDLTVGFTDSQSITWPTPPNT